MTWRVQMVPARRQYTRGQVRNLLFVREADARTKFSALVALGERREDIRWHYYLERKVGARYQIVETFNGWRT